MSGPPRFPYHPAAAAAAAALLLLAATSPAAFAHPGHGMAPPHGRASDVMGFAVVVGTLIAAAAGRRR